MKAVTEDAVEELALTHFSELGYRYIYGPELAPGESAAERADYGDVVLKGRLENALRRLNPEAPADAIDAAMRKVLIPEASTLVQNNRRFHVMLRDGVEIEVAEEGGQVLGKRLRLVDFDNPGKNDWLVVNQFMVIEQGVNKRLDVVVFLNGLPIAVLELKNTANENADIKDAYYQLETYKSKIPSMFVYNELLVISDGTMAQIGTTTSPWERFQPWRTVDGSGEAPPSELAMLTLLRGVFEKTRLLDLLRNFVVFEDDGESTFKKLAGYHQFHAVRVAVSETVRATSEDGNRKVGVIWHTQGSGKSLSMAFYAGKVILQPEMANPTVVVITDRNDLDDQLFGTFAGCKEILRQVPKQAKDRDDLRKLLSVASGGVVFTTIQKFLPEDKREKFPTLSERTNIVVMADEAHRSQYGFGSKLRVKGEQGYLVPGFAQHMRDALPNASFIGFTGTPVELADKNTRGVFGDYIHVYDIQQAVEDGATVPIYYESRLAKLDLDEAARAALDQQFEEVTEDEEDDRREQLKSRWGALEAIVGDQKRLELIAKDMLEHYDARTSAMPGKALVVCMSRRVCVELYAEIVKLRPEWHSEEDAEGALKVVMTGSSSDKPAFQPHIRNKTRLRELAKRFRDPEDPFRVVIVRDMWLTGFDAPCLHSMYIDKPMQGHGLMQAIARVNRVFGEKPGGLVVDYLGLAESLKKALAVYTESGGKGTTAIDLSKAVAVMLEKVEVCRGLFHGFDYAPFLSGSPSERLMLLPAAQQHILELEDGRHRLVQGVTALSRAVALSKSRPEAVDIQDEVAFFQTVKAVLVKSSLARRRRSLTTIEAAIRQIVSGAIVADGVIDVFRAAGLKNPDVSILSDEFLAEIREMPQKNLAVELLNKLLYGELRARRKQSVVQFEAFSAKLEKAINRYRNRAVETAQVIEELILSLIHISEPTRPY